MNSILQKPNVIILGSGPAGLGAAFQLTKKKLAAVTVIEQVKTVGGIAGSFDICGIKVDYGSHRLHPACDHDILRDIKTLLGSDLLDRPRHGRIRLQKRWIHFPLNPVDLMFNLPFNFLSGSMIDWIKKGIRGKQKKKTDTDSFASVLEAGLGKTICREFYFPYIQKIWGLLPEEISPIQAYRRVSANSHKKILLKVLTALPGFKSAGKGRFFYPKEGFGQISNRLYDEAKNNGADFYLGADIKSIQMREQTIESITSATSNKKELIHHPDYVWSTIPVGDLIKLIQPEAPDPIINASNNIKYRSMILVYLVLGKNQFSEYDAHYFPEPDIKVTRISEPKNYNNILEPHDCTVLCAEIPCFIDDPEWSMTDTELGEIVSDCLKRTSLQLKAPIKKIISHRISHAYPIYHKGYELYFDQVDQWLNQVNNLLSFGRQGLFVHDNTHHALQMAYAAVDCFGKDGQFNTERWHKFYRKTFKDHVVED